MSRNKFTKRVLIELDWTDINELKNTMRNLTERILEGNECFEHIDRRKTQPVTFRFSQWYLRKREAVEKSEGNITIHTVKSRL